MSEAAQNRFDLSGVEIAPKVISILGATGSIGQNTLDIVRQVNNAAGGSACDGPLSIQALTANYRVQELVDLAREFRPRSVVITDETKLVELQDALRGEGIDVAGGETGLIEAGAADADWVMAAIVGAAGLRPTLAAVRKGATVSLANKECLVCAGDVFISEVKRSGGTLLTADSEHNAIFQVLDFDNLANVEKITLTASGGPFRTWSLERIAEATPEQAVAHPNWDMGAKISVDSATMMNKGLEIIEACYLFPVGEDKIDAVVHPQSVVHGLVKYCDGSILAQLGSPDMRTPIASTLAWPDRLDIDVKPLDLVEVGNLSFEVPDHAKFPALNLARAAYREGGLAPTVLNAANEIGVQAFLDQRIGFLEIVQLVEACLEKVLPGLDNGTRGNLDLECCLEADKLARIGAEEIVGRSFE